MAQSDHRKVEERERIRLHKKAEEPARIPDSTAVLSPEEDYLLHGPDGILSHGTAENQIARLSDPRLAAGERHFIADQIGQSQGNLHLQRVVANVNGSGNGHQAGEPALPEEWEEFLGLSGLPSLAASPPPADNGTIQAKLTINPPNDEYEQEADQVAETVMRMPEETDLPPEEQPEEKADIQLSTAGQTQAADTPPVTPEVESGIKSMQGRGQPLPDSDRSFFENRFSQDFSQVRLHTDSQAVQTSQQLNARAFTVGSDIAFNEGEYQPGSSDSRHLLAHELTHVVQQGGSEEKVSLQEEADPTSEEVIQRNEAPATESITPTPVPVPTPDIDVDTTGEDTTPTVAAQTDQIVDTAENVQSEMDKIPEAQRPEPEPAPTPTPPEGAEQTPVEDGQPEQPDISAEEAAQVEDADDDMAEMDTDDLALIDEELAEHQRWAGAADRVGEAGSADRAEFIAETVGSEFVGGAAEGAQTAIAMDLASGVAIKAGTKLLSKSAKFTKFVPVVGPALTLGMSAYGLAARDWGATGETLGKFGQGSSEYEKLANSIAAISEIVDILAQVTGLIAGVAGVIAAIATALSATVVLAPATGTVAGVAGNIALGAGIASTILDLINMAILQPLVLLFRSLHTFKSEADPREVESQGTEIATAATTLGGAWGGEVTSAVSSKGSDAPESKASDTDAPKPDTPDPDTKKTTPDGKEPVVKYKKPTVDENGQQFLPGFEPSPSTSKTDKNGQLTLPGFDTPQQTTSSQTDIPTEQLALPLPTNDVSKSQQYLPGFGDKPTKTKQLPQDDLIGNKNLGTRKPINYSYAGETYSFKDKNLKLYEKYPQGVKFTNEGHPDFKPYTPKEIDGQPIKAVVKIDMKGDSYHDYKAANKEAGLEGLVDDITKPPEGFRWHHHEDIQTMVLVPADLHDNIRHTGGRSNIKNRKIKSNNEIPKLPPGPQPPLMLPAPKGQTDNTALPFKDMPLALPPGPQPPLMLPAPNGPDGLISDDKWSDWASMQATNTALNSLNNEESKEAAIDERYTEDNQFEEKAERVNPDYPEPPGTPEQIEAIQAEILQLLDSRAQAEQVETKMSMEEEEHQALQPDINNALEETDGAISATQAHEEAVARRKQTNQEQQERQQEAQSQIGNYFSQKMGLLVLTVPLFGFERFTHFASKALGIVNSPAGWLLPGSIKDTILNWKEKMDEMNEDAREFQRSLSQMDTMMEQQETAQPPRQQELQSDQGRIETTEEKAGISKEEFEKAKQGTQLMQETNQEKISEAGEIKEEATENKAELDETIAQKEEEAQSLTDELQSWAEEHQAARQTAIEETKQQLQAEGYEITGEPE